MSEHLNASQPEPTVSRTNRPRKVYAGMWGIPEIAVVGAGLLGVLIFVLLLALLVLPARRELENNKQRRNQIESELTTAKARYGTISSTKERVDELERSANDFETRFLRSENESKVALYQRINGLIGALGLTNTSGPDYVPLLIEGNRTQTSEDKGGRSKFLSIFPGVYVTVTVDGSYQNLRRFISEIETGGEFIVISAVEIEPSENKEKKTQESEPGPNSNTSRPMPGGVTQPIASTGPVDRGKTYGETVTLRIELASYFRRPDYSPLTETVSKQ